MFGLISAGISAIAGGLSAVGSAIGAACSAVGGAVISAGRVAVDALSRGLPMFEKICDVALTVGKGLGIFPPEGKDVDMYELGMRTERAVEGGVTSEQFDSNQAYIEHLREKIDLSKADKENLENENESLQTEKADLESQLDSANGEKASLSRKLKRIAPIDVDAVITPDEVNDTKLGIGESGWRLELNGLKYKSDLIGQLGTIWITNNAKQLLPQQLITGLAYYLGIRELEAGLIRQGPGAPASQLDTILKFKPTILIAIPSFLIKIIAEPLMPLMLVILMCMEV